MLAVSCCRLGPDSSASPEASVSSESLVSGAASSRRHPFQPESEFRPSRSLEELASFAPAERLALFHLACRHSPPCAPGAVVPGQAQMGPSLLPSPRALLLRQQLYG